MRDFLEDAHKHMDDGYGRAQKHVRQELPKHQITAGKERGSWDPSRDAHGELGGRLYVTCLCTFMLEVYYRHLPIYDFAFTEGMKSPAE